MYSLEILFKDILFLQPLIPFLLSLFFLFEIAEDQVNANKHHCGNQKLADDEQDFKIAGIRLHGAKLSVGSVLLALQFVHDDRSGIAHI